MFNMKRQKERRCTPKTLPSTKVLQELFNYDQETGWFTWKVRKGSKAKGQRAGQISLKGYRIISINKTIYSEHRLVFAWMGVDIDASIDHIDRNRANNAWKNLRLVSKAENARNRDFKVVNKSGHRHIIEQPSSIEGQPSRWRVSIHRTDIGNFGKSFETLEHAIKGRDAYLAKLVIQLNSEET